MKYIVGDTFITVMLGTKLETVHNTHPNFGKIKEAIKAEKFDELEDLINVSKSIETFGKGFVEVSEGVVKYKGQPLNNGMTDRLLKMKEEGFNIKPLVAFLENLMENPSYRAINELYGFLEYGKLPITEDGHFVAYKKVRNNFTDIWTGKFDNSIGATPNMPRNMVDEDSNRTCSNGLHFCSYEYLKSFGSTPDNKVVILKINPRDVVAIPKDYNNTKGRCCRYEVIDELKDYNDGGTLDKASVYEEDKKPEVTYEDVANIFENVIEEPLESLVGYTIQFSGEEMEEIEEELNSINQNAYLALEEYIEDNEIDGDDIDELIDTLVVALS